MEAWTFEAISYVDCAAIAAVARAAPANPFYTPEYAEARRIVGERVCVLTLRTREQLLACPAFISGGPTSGSLEIPSVLPLPNEAVDVFWTGVRRICAQLGVWEVKVQSFGSSEVTLRPIGETVWRRERTEYVLDLQAPEGLPRCASNHFRNAARARKRGTRVRRSTDPACADLHVRLMDNSMQRRAERGESVSRMSDPSPFAALLHAGAGELYQAVDGEEVRSSLLVLRAPRGAYYHSAGTTRSGMEQGASHLLVTEITALLRAEGLAIFNLGGAEPDSGLQRFKSGFGTRPVKLAAAGYSIRPRWMRKARTALRLIKHATRSNW